MIVTDTNVIASLALRTPNTALAEQLLAADPDWIAPQLWRSEFRNVLSLYLRKSLVTFADAVRFQAEAESLMQDREYEVSSLDVLELVRQSPCSAYDCEYVALAKNFGIKLVTMDRRIVRAFPAISILPIDFLSTAKDRHS